MIAPEETDKLVLWFNDESEALKVVKTLSLFDQENIYSLTSCSWYHHGRWYIARNCLTVVNPITYPDYKPRIGDKFRHFLGGKVLRYGIRTRRGRDDV